MALRSRYACPSDPQDNSCLTLNVPTQPKRTAVCPSPIERGESSSTPDDMEPTRTRTRLPKSTTIEAIIDMYGERPLPPVPRIPPSIYASSKRSTTCSSDLPVSSESPGAVVPPPSPAIPSPITPVRTKILTEKDLKSAKHLSQLYRKESKLTSSPNDALVKRRDLGQEAGVPSVSKTKGKAVKSTPFTEWKAPVYQEPSISSDSSPRTPLSQRAVSFDSARPLSLIGKTVEERAANYFPVIHPTKPVDLGVDRRSSLSAQTGSRSFPSPKIRLAAKQPVALYPLRTSSLPDTLPQSHFSPSSPNASDIDSPIGVASSLRTRAKKVLLQSRTPRRPGLKQWMSSSQSDLSCVSPMTTPPPSICNSTPRRNSMQQGLSDLYTTLQSMYAPSRQAFTKSTLSRGDQSSPFKRKTRTREMQSPALSFTKHSKYDRRAGEEPKKHAYVYRVPRKRLSKPQIAAASTTTISKCPDTTYKIEMPAPPTPKRPKSSLFDQNYHIEMPTPNVLTLLPAPSTVIIARTNTTKSHHFSSSFNGSLSNRRHSDCFSRAEKQRVQRYSLPVATHTRQNTDDTTLSKVPSQTNGSSTTSRKDGKSLGQKLVTSLSMLGLARKETDPVSGPDAERGRLTEKKDRITERNASSIRSISVERRRQDLKKMIVVMGDPSTVGVPF